MITIGYTGKFRITEAVFRFSADVRLGGDVREAQLRLIRDGEAVVHTPEQRKQSLLENPTAEYDEEQTEWEDEA